MATVAVVTPTIPPRKDLLRRALQSVWSQSRQPDQVVVEDDSTRTGSAATRNRANARVVTDYIAVLDDDDELLPNHLDVLMRAAEEKPDADVIYPIPHFDNLGDPCWITVEGVQTRPWGLEWGESHRNTVLSGQSFIPHTCLMKTSKVREVGGYDENPPIGLPFDDRNLFCRILSNGGVFLHVPEVTWIWRPNPIGHTGGHPNRW